MAFFTSSCTLSTIFQIENKSIGHDLAGKVVLVVSMKLISGGCVSMNSEAELQHCLQRSCSTMRNTLEAVAGIGNTYPLDVVEEGKYQ